MRKIEDVVFACKVPNVARLEEYGFTKSATRWVYEEDFLDGDMRAIVSVDNKGQVTGLVWDVVSEEEYMPLRIESYDGAYVNTVRSCYEEILLDIADKCCDEMAFACPQANRITQKIYAKYRHDPDFPWDDNNAVFRNPSNKKWYGLIMYIPLSKLTQNEKDEDNYINVLNLKIDESDGSVLRATHGIYSAYHMNHKSWISVRLDDVLDDDTIMELIDVSYGFTLGRSGKRSGGAKNWIVPANPKYYDIVGAFTGVDQTIWKQGKGIEVGDTVYMYVGAPYSAILYKCYVTDTHIATSNRGGKANVMELMKVRIDARYPTKKCTLYKMKQFGVTTVRGPRFMPDELIKFLEEDK
ncbi:MAG: MmcQ/YjbR family DNA-binding protein [Saccharofermentans sp.]|nr:MmcQ/YjbR family DNA-binding protein [Saccharofermentans sp.]